MHTSKDSSISPMDCTGNCVVRDTKNGTVKGRKTVTFNLNANTVHIYEGYLPYDPLRPQKPRCVMSDINISRELEECRNDMELAMEVD